MKTYEEGNAIITAVLESARLTKDPDRHDHAPCYVIPAEVYESFKVMMMEYMIEAKGNVLIEEEVLKMEEEGAPVPNSEG